MSSTPGDPRRTGQSGVSLQRPLELARSCSGGSDPWLPPDSLDPEHTLVPIELGIEPPDQTITLHDRQDVVPVPSLGVGNERLKPVVESEQPQAPSPVA